MSKTWQLQEAKNRLSELVQKAGVEGPQTITVRGNPTAIVLSIEEYNRLTSPKTKLIEFFKTAPFGDLDIEFTRNADAPREIDL